MKRVGRGEAVDHYHMVEVDDEIDIEKVVADAKTLIKMSSGVEALADILEDYKYHHGLDYCVQADFCGTSTDNLTVYDEAD